MQNSLQRSTPEEQGIASQSILAFIEAADKTIEEFHSVMLLRHGKVVAEGWWSPYSDDHSQMMFSLSKSFTSTAIGLAIADKHLSLDDRVISFFADDLPDEVSENLRAMRVRHLLSMSTGHAADTMPLLTGRADGEWVKGFLESPVEYAPGTHFIYNTGATYMLSAILQKLTGTRLLDYLQPRLMEPLGIEGATWELSPQGIHMGGFGLSIRTEDIAKFGQLYLQKGMWQGRQLVPEAWIAEATSKQVSNGSDPNNDWAQGYGFQFWRCRPNQVYRGDGAFGQFCIVMPEQDAVVAITSAVSNMQAVMNLVWDSLLPALQGADPLPADAANYEALQQKLASLALLPPQGQPSSPFAAQVDGKVYEFEENGLGFQSVRFDFSDSRCTLTLTSPNGVFPIACAIGEWHAGSTAVMVRESLIVASAVWSAEQTLLVTVRLYETPFFNTLKCQFADSHVTIDVAANVGFGPLQNILIGRETQPVGK